MHIKGERFVQIGIPQHNPEIRCKGNEKVTNLQIYTLI